VVGENIMENINAQIQHYEDIIPRISKRNRLKYLCIESNNYTNWEKDGFSDEFIVSVIMNMINIQDNLEQLCLCGLTGFNLRECVRFEGLLSLFITGCYVFDEVLIKISSKAPLLRDLILSSTTIIDPDNDDDYDLHNSLYYNGGDSYSNIGVNAILQNCTALECLELGGNSEWEIDSLLNKHMFNSMSCFNLKRVAFANLKDFDDDSIKTLCDNTVRLEQFAIDGQNFTTNAGILYLIEKYSGSLIRFIDKSHRYSGVELCNIALILDHIHEFVAWFNEDEIIHEFIPYEIIRGKEITTEFKRVRNSKELKTVSIVHVRFDNYEQMHSYWSFWDCMEYRVQSEGGWIGDDSDDDSESDDDS
jgi:hypothetical protein